MKYIPLHHQITQDESLLFLTLLGKYQSLPHELEKYRAQRPYHYGYIATQPVDEGCHVDQENRHVEHAASSLNKSQDHPSHK